MDANGNFTSEVGDTALEGKFVLDAGNKAVIGKCTAIIGCILIFTFRNTNYQKSVAQAREPYTQVPL